MARLPLPCGRGQENHYCEYSLFDIDTTSYFGSLGRKINITIWNELNASNYRTDNRWGMYGHMANQHDFLGLCHKQLLREGWKWAFSIDIDEYFMVNHLLRVPGQRLYHLKLSNALIVPFQREASSIPKLLTRVEPYRDIGNPFLYTRPCLQYPRKQFSNAGNYSLSPVLLEALSADDNLLKGIDTPLMNTFRWPYLSTHVVHGKGIAELFRLKIRNVKKFHTPHYPVGERHLCRDMTEFVPENSPLVIHHYPATWSELIGRTNLPYLVRNGDTRKYGAPGNTTAYLEYRYKMESKTTNVVDQHIQEWLLGFIDSVGKEEAERLLKNVGKQKEAKLGAEIDWVRAD